MNDFGSQLRRLREGNSLTQKELADRLGYSNTTISRLETGTAQPLPEFAIKADKEFRTHGLLISLAIESNTQRPAKGAPFGLPEPPRNFIGRTIELDRIVDDLLDPKPRTVVIGGFPGVGKTDLAVTAGYVVSRNYPDGCVFLTFPAGRKGTASEPLTALLELFDNPDRLPSGIDGRLNLLRTHFTGKRMLLIFDNVTSVQQVRSLIPGEPRCGVVITSRNRLPALDDARHISLNGLSVEDSTTLFRLTAEDASVPEEPVIEIVKSCSCLPLAIRIAATSYRDGGYALHQLHQRLGSQTTKFDALEDGDRSIAAALKVSCDDLQDDQRRLLLLLALHPEGFVDVPSVAALADLEVRETAQLLDRLHNAYLLERHRPTGNVKLHDLVRTLLIQYELRQATLEHQDAAIGRLFEHTVNSVVNAAQLLEPDRHNQFADAGASSNTFTSRSEALTWLRDRWPTHVALCELAAERGDLTSCLALAYSLRSFFGREKLLEPWVRTHLCALELARKSDDLKNVAMILNNLGMAYLEQGDLSKAAAAHQEAATQYQRIGDDLGRTDALASLAWVQIYQGHTETALRELAAACSVYRRDGRRRNEMITLRGMALSATAMGRVTEAQKYVTQARAMTHTPRDELLVSNLLGWIHFCAKDYAEAETHYTEATDIGASEKDGAELARAFTGLGNIAAVQGKATQVNKWWMSADAQEVELNPAVVGELRVRAQLSA